MSTAIKNFEATDEKLKTLIEDFFLILSQTEKKVITKRFSLDDQPKQTLEKIGQHFDVTRERIRQIENNALKKLQRNVMNSHIRNITDVARNILQANGGVLTSDALISKALIAMHNDTSYTANVIRFAMAILFLRKIKFN